MRRSSTASTTAPTWRSLVAVTMRKTSVMPICSDTSNATRSLPFFDAAASAASRVSWIASVVAGTKLLVFAVQAAFCDVLDDAVRHEIPDRQSLGDAPPAVRRRDRQRRHLDEGDLVRRKA